MLISFCYQFNLLYLLKRKKPTVMSSYKRTILDNSNSHNNKENKFHSVRHSAFSPKSGTTPSKTNFIVKEGTNISDSRLRNVMDSRDEFQKLYDVEKKKRKDEGDAYRAQICKIQANCDRLQQEKISLEEEINSLLKKYKFESEKNDVLEKNLQRLQRQKQENLEKVQQPVESARKTIKLQEKVQRLQKQKTQLEELTNMIKQQYSQLQAQFSQLKKSSHNVSLKNERSQWGRHQQISNTLENTITQLTNQLTESYKTNQHAKEEHLRVVTQMQVLFKQEVKKLLEEKTSLEKGYSQKMKENTKLKKQFADLKTKFDQLMDQGKDLENKNSKWQDQYKKIVDSRDKLMQELAQNKITAQKLKAQLEDNNQDVSKEYEQEIQKLKLEILSLVAGKDQLSKAYKIQISKNEELEGLIVCFQAKIKEKQQENRRDSDLWQSLEEAYNQKQKQYVLEIEKLHKERDREIENLKSVISCLQVEKEKWRNYTNQYNQEFEDIRRQNRRLKKDLEEEKETNIQRSKTIGRRMQQLESLTCELQNEKRRLLEIHQQEISQVKMLAKVEEETMSQREKENVLKVRNEVERQLKNSHQVEINKLKKKIQEQSKRENQKHSHLQKQYESTKKQYLQTIDEIDIKNKEIRGLMEKIKDLERNLSKQIKNSQEFRRQINRLKDYGQDNKRKLQFQLEDRSQKAKKHKDELEQLKKKLEQAIIIKQEMTEEGRENSLKNKKTQEKCRKLESQIVKLREDLTEIQKSKWQLEDKILLLQRNNVRLQALKNQFQQELIANSSKTQLSHHSELQRLNQTIKVKNDEIEALISAKNVLQKEKYTLKQTIQSKSQIESQLKLLKGQQEELQRELCEKAKLLKFSEQQKEKLMTKIVIIEEQQKARQSKLNQLQKKERKEVYTNLCKISNQFFEIEFKESEIQFLTILYHKMRIWVDYTTKLKEQVSKYRRLDQVKQQQYSKTRGKQLEQNLGLKEQYDIIYRKYLKYKEAYISCRGKIERQRHDIVQDQRFTEQIITHCKTLVAASNHNINNTNYNTSHNSTKKMNNNI